MSLHYGLWYKDTRNFVEALRNTNKYMAEKAEVAGDHRILDAGWGVGGAAVYLASNYSCRVTGVSLSELQVETARENAKKFSVDSLVDFKLCDYSQTGFQDASFDIVWACESSSSGPNKAKMLEEWSRILKPGGRLIILDFFKTHNLDADGNTLINKWCDLWAMSPLVSSKEMSSLLEASDFDIIDQENLTTQIVPTIRWMYKSYLLGSIPAKLYNLFFGARKYSRNHYKSGLYQYRAYKKGLWTYQAILARKK